MPYVSPPVEQTWPALAARKRNAAQKLEYEAARKRCEADELDRKWVEFRARKWPESSAS